MSSVMCISGTKETPSSYWTSSTRAKRYAVIEDDLAPYICGCFWVLFLIGTLFFAVVAFGQGFATGRAEPRFVAMLEKSTDWKYFRNVSVTGTHGQTNDPQTLSATVLREWCGYNSNRFALPMGNPNLRDFCFNEGNKPNSSTTGIFACSHCLSPPMSAEYTYNMYGSSGNEILIPTAVVLWEDKKKCDPQLFFLTDIEDTVMRINFYATTAQHLTSLSYTTAELADEIDIEFTAAMSQIESKLLASNGLTLQGECPDLSTIDEEGQFGVKDCAWGQPADTTGATTTEGEATSKGATDAYVTIGNLIRAAGISDLNAENARFKNTVHGWTQATDFKTTSPFLPKCECEFGNPLEYANFDYTQGNTDMCFGTETPIEEADMSTYPYRLSGVDLVMDVNWKNHENCQGSNVLQMACIMGIMEAAMNMGASPAVPITASVQLSVLGAEPPSLNGVQYEPTGTEGSAVGTQNLKPLLSKVEGDFFYEVYGIRILVTGSANNLYASESDWVNLGWAMLWAAILVSSMLWLMEYAFFGRCCNCCFDPKCCHGLGWAKKIFGKCFDQNNNKYNRMKLKYVWESSTSSTESGSVKIQRLNLQPAQPEKKAQEIEAQDEAAKKLKAAEDLEALETARQKLKRYRNWLRDILIIEAENIPKRGTAQDATCCSSPDNDEYTKFLKTRIEALRLLCREVDDNAPHAKEANSINAASIRSKRYLGSAADNDKACDRNLLRTAMIEMYNSLITQESSDWAAAAFTEDFWPSESISRHAGGDSRMDAGEEHEEAKVGSRDNFTGDDKLSYNQGGPLFS